MPPFRVEYLCQYRPLWRWDGEEWSTLLLASGEALALARQGRRVRIVDFNNRVMWST